MKRIAPTAMALSMMLTTAGFAEDNPVVVELFTSQGCASCPPADRLLHKLSRRDDVIALALHVDYWDYIGWQDVFALPENATRQRAYARVAERHMIYTPQMIVNGQDDIVGVHAMELADLIAAHQALPRAVDLDTSRADGRVSIRAKALAPLDGPVTVQLIRYTPTQRTEITRGENAGQVFDYANVVDDWQILQQWSGESALEVDLEIDGIRPVVVLIQEPGPGPILAAALAK
ncbi:DUF1223 domain-containing protein [Rhodobacteraceae bacterium F11138]|nr:DUF1223 domain-containing protein [Rhodobacteraceae bacterium F11138]